MLLSSVPTSVLFTARIDVRQSVIFARKLFSTLP